MDQDEILSGFGVAPIKAEGSAISYDVGAGAVLMSSGTGTAPIWSNQATVTAGQIKSHGRPVEIKPFEVNPDMAMLEDASSPYNIDPETLSNLWVVRFGKGWVGSEAVEDMDAEENNWWRHAANRLRELGHLEMHTLASSYRVVLRIVE